LFIQLPIFKIQMEKELWKHAFYPPKKRI